MIPISTFRIASIEGHSANYDFKMPLSVLMKLEPIVNIISVTMSMLVFLGIVVYHTVLSLKKRYGTFKCCKKRNQLLNDISEISDRDISLTDSPAHVVCRRESLIYDIN